jgi:hypothetical protein
VVIHVDGLVHGKSEGKPEGRNPNDESMTKPEGRMGNTAGALSAGKDILPSEGLRAERAVNFSFLFHEFGLGMRCARVVRSVIRNVDDWRTFWVDQGKGDWTSVGRGERKRGTLIFADGH